MGWSASQVAGAHRKWLGHVRGGCHVCIGPWLGLEHMGDTRAWLGGQETSMEGWAGLGTHGACQTELGDVEPGQGARQKGEVCPEGAGRAVGRGLTAGARRRGQVMSVCGFGA